MILTQGKEHHFKRHVRSRWMIDRVKYRNTVRLYAFFTCPRCGGINQAPIIDSYEEEGIFDCIYCIVCHRNLQLYMRGFKEVYLREEERLQAEKTELKRRKHEPVHV